MTDGTNVIDLRRRAAQYLNKILRGGQPADLLIEQPTKFELVINLQDREGPRADQVIE